jgi:dienelactone hydrolase
MAPAPHGETDLTSVSIPSGGVVLEGDLGRPAPARAVVVFAHGSGSSRLSPRNRFVARVLRQGGLGTLLTDLLTREEEQQEKLTRQLRFDIPLLAERLTAVVDFMTGTADTRGFAVGLFGASTGAAAALATAAERPGVIRAVVSRGGRPDLAAHALPRVRAPTLLIVGERDPVVLDLNRAALERLPGEKALTVVPGASHLFEEAGALEEVARLAAEWFQRHLPSDT